MSYCRFSEGDVYMYPSAMGGIECCGCKLMPPVKTVFTFGLKKPDPRTMLFGEIEPCTCNGEGCEKCMKRVGSQTFQTRTEAVEHLREHRRAGHDVPDDAIARINAEITLYGEYGGLEMADPFMSVSGDVGFVSFDKSMRTGGISPADKAILGGLPKSSEEVE